MERPTLSTHRFSSIPQVWREKLMNTGEVNPSIPKGIPLKLSCTSRRVA